MCLKISLSNVVGKPRNFRFLAAPNGSYWTNSFTNKSYTLWGGAYTSHWKRPKAGRKEESQRRKEKHSTGWVSCLFTTLGLRSGFSLRSGLRMAGKPPPVGKLQSSWLGDPEYRVWSIHSLWEWRGKWQKKEPEGIPNVFVNSPQISGWPRNRPCMAKAKRTELEFEILSAVEIILQLSSARFTACLRSVVFRGTESRISPS